VPRCAIETVFSRVIREAPISGDLQGSRHGEEVIESQADMSVRCVSPVTSVNVALLPRNPNAVITRVMVNADGLEGQERGSLIRVKYPWPR
jgi:hypothetical protein